MVKNVLLLGASGSVGLQTLEVIRTHPDRFSLTGFSIGDNVGVAKEIIEEFNVSFCWVKNKEDQIYLEQEYLNVTVLTGDQGLLELVDVSNANWVVNALIGFVGFLPTLHAIEHGKNIALANKETLVAGGKIIMEAIKRHRVQLTPIDSEHSAIYQCLIGHNLKSVHKIYLTASGGAFRDLEHHELGSKTKNDALKHPNWSMGAKITIDSATMMNKGLEVIEAHWLFNLDYNQIDVLIQPESVIHGLVEFKDTSVMAQLASSDMRLPIQMALTDQEHVNLAIERLSFEQGMNLSLSPVKKGRYPLFELALRMGRLSGNAPAIMNGANEVAVAFYLEDKIGYYDLEQAVLYACENFEYQEITTVDDVLAADEIGRQLADRFLRSVVSGSN